MKTLTILGRRWFEKTNGNTYHSVRIYIDNVHMHTMPFSYGYGSQYEQSAIEWLEKNGHLPGREKYSHGGGEGLWRYCEKHGITLLNEVIDVTRRKDL